MIGPFSFILLTVGIRETLVGVLSAHSRAAWRFYPRSRLSAGMVFVSVKPCECVLDALHPK